MTIYRNAIPNAIRTLVPMPGWIEAMERQGEVTGEASAFMRVPLVFRAINLRCNDLASVPIHIYSGDTELEDGWPFEQDLSELIWMTEAAMLLKGASFWLKNRNRVSLKGAQWLNPFTVRVEMPLGVEPIPENIRFIQSVNARQFGPWTTDEVAYFREFHPTDDIGPGISATAVALGNAKLMDYVTRFAGQFFAGGAMPVTVLGMPEATTDEEAKHAEGFFKRQMRGLANAFRVLAVRGDLKLATITPPLKDMAMPELKAQALAEVAWAFGLPRTMLEDAANYATAGAHDLQYWQNTIRPRCPKFQNVINNQFLKGTDIRVEFAPDEMDVFQEDESQRATSLQSLVNSKLPLRLAMEILGYDLTEEQWAMLAADEQRRQETAERIQGQIAGADDEDEDNRMQQQRDMADRQREEDLRKWQRLVLRRLSEGKAHKVTEFKGAHVPPSLHAAISARLEGVQDEVSVRAIFANAARAKGVPQWQEYRKDEDDMKSADFLKALEAIASRPVELSLAIKTDSMTIEQHPSITVEAPQVSIPVTVQPAEAPVSVTVQPSTAEVKVVNEVKTPDVKVTNEVKMPRLVGRAEETTLERDSKGRPKGSKGKVRYEYED
jgi:HK97 family phage portal protein